MSKKKREMDTMPFVWLMFTFPFVLISAWMIAEGIPVLYTCILFKQDGVSTIGTALTIGREPQFRGSWGLPAKIEFKDHNGMVPKDQSVPLYAHNSIFEQFCRFLNVIE